MSSAHTNLYLELLLVVCLSVQAIGSFMISVVVMEALTLISILFFQYPRVKPYGSIFFSKKCSWWKWINKC